MLFKKTILPFILCLPFLYKAQSYNFFNYGVKDGLAQSNVSGIVQDSAGFYWIATAGGVSKFDGKNFTTYTTDDGLADNNVSAIYIDRHHTMWLGHGNGLLTHFDGKVFTEIKSKILPKDKRIFSFSEDAKGSLWISTESKGAIKIIDPSRRVNERLLTQVFSAKDGLSQLVLNTLEDKKGNVWFLTDIGIKIYNKKDLSFDFFRPEGMSLGQITSIAKNSNSTFLFGTMNGSVSKFNPETKVFETYITPEEMFQITQGFPNIVYALHEDKKSNIWISVLNWGVIRYNKKSKKRTYFNTGNGLSDNKVKSIFEDREGNILLSTSGEGVDVFTSEKFVSHSKENGLVDNQIWAICETNDGNFWFGTNEGLAIFNPNETKLNAYKSISISEGLPARNARSIVKDKQGNLWIGTWGGKVIKYDVSKSKLQPSAILNDIVNNLVSCLLVDKNNKLWIGTVEGIVLFDIANQSIKTYRTIDGLSDNDITCLYEDSKGIIWIGTRQKGLTAFDGKTFTKYNRENGLTYSNISAITEDNKHTIWIGTEGGGAFSFDGKTFTNYKTKNGLLSDFITLVGKDKLGNIWLGSNKGLNKYSSDKYIFSSYLKNDGYTGVETKPRAFYLDSKNNIWFGTVNGAYRYSPELDVPILLEPQTNLLNFKVNLNDVAITNPVKLSYKENSLSFNFVSISLSNPEGVIYKIKLEGYDDDWKVTSKNESVSYSNLPHGKYTFKLMACNSSGVCNAKAMEIKIIITPPYWMTWWFYLIVFGVVVSGLFAYIKIRERKLRLEKKILEDKVTERTTEIVEQKKVIEEKQKEIIDSINYAKRIQFALLASNTLLKNNFNEHFVLFKPKDVVSGDFYWATPTPDGFVYITADCTGHGVPGAFMSLLNISKLSQTINENKITSPGLILDNVRTEIINVLNAEGSAQESKDGMDAVLCKLDTKNMMLEYAAANNSFYIIRNHEIITSKADKMPVGKYDDNLRAFTTVKFPLQKGDIIYTFTDGFADQFGGPKGKKYKYKQLEELLLNCHNEPMEKQSEILQRSFEEWKGKLEQVDDVLVIGVRI